MRWLPIRSVFSACAMLRFEGHEFRDFVLQRSSLISQLANFLQQDADLARECLAEVVEVPGIAMEKERQRMLRSRSRERR